MAKEIQRAKSNVSDPINRLRAGRLAYEERFIILQKLGEYAQKQYARYVESNSQGYDLSLIKDGLQFEPDIYAFENLYWVDNRDSKLDEIAVYFENGTGIFNTKHRKSDRRKISLRGSDKLMVFRKPWKGVKAAWAVKGVRPIFMFRRTLKSIEFNRAHLQRQIRFSFGI